MMRNLRQEHLRCQQQVNNYILRHNISMWLAVGVKDFIKARSKLDSENTFGADESFMRNLPTWMQCDLHVEARTPLLVANRFFRMVAAKHDRCFRQISHNAFSERHSDTNDVIFSTNDACWEMYFIESGEFQYLHQ